MQEEAINPKEVQFNFPSIVGRKCSNATFEMSGSSFRDNGFRNSTTSFPNDVDYFLGGRFERPDFDIMCGADSRPVIMPISP